MRAIFALMALFMVIGTEWVLASVSPDEQLIVFTQKGDLAGVKQALAAGAKINTPFGPTALLKLVVTGGTGEDDYKIVKLLLEHGADINAVGPEGMSVFQMALTGRIQLQGRSIFPLLLDHKPDLNFVTKDGYSVVGLAMRIEGFDSIEVKNASGLTSRYPDRLQAARKVVELGAPVDILSGAGLTPLMEIAGYNRAGDSMGHPYYLDFAKLLLAKGADPTRRNQAGKTAADYALENENYDMLLLLDAGQKHRSEYGKLKKRDTDQRLSLGVARQISISHGWSPSIDPIDSMGLITEALKLGANPNALSVDHQTTIFGQAIGDYGSGPGARGDASLINLLLDHGADPNMPLPNGKTPLEFARSQPELFALLQSRGAKPDHALQLALAASPAEIDDIREATFRYQFAHNASGQQQAAKVYFLSFVDELSERSDPNDGFMKRFAGNNPRVAKNSDSGVSKNGVVADKKTGEEGLIFTVRAIKWISTNEVEVEGGYYEAGLSSSGNTYYLKKKDGKWMVTKNVMHWIS